MTRVAVCAVVTDGEASRLVAQGVAQRLDLPLLERPDWEQLPGAGLVLQFDADGLALRPLGPGAAGPVRVDFGSGASDHRRRFGGGKGQMIARAVGLNKGGQLQVLDATAGLGRDAFVLASLGCQLTLLERSPVVAELLADGLRRGRQQGSAELQAILARIHSHHADSKRYLRQLALDGKQFDIVYLDPMFPERGKSARVKKEMAVFHALVGPDPDAATLLSLALPVARFRVVVKRPRKAPTLDQKAPTFQLEGKSSRFDIYVNAAIVTRPTLDVGQ